MIGMVMAVKLVYSITSKNILLLAGYEGGFTAVHTLPRKNSGSALELAQLVYLSQPHTQPVLSVDVSPDTKVFFTSSADAIIAAHHVPELLPDSDNIEDENSLVSLQIARGSQALDVDEIEGAEEGSIKPVSTHAPPISTQGVDSPREHFDTPSEPLSFSRKHLPASSTTHPPISFPKVAIPDSSAHPTKTAGLSSLLSTTTTHNKSKAKASPPMPQPLLTLQPAYKTIDTKHAGQQSLCVRSDGRLIVTGGWDTRIRIYSSKTLKEVAVLKWHKEGVYAVAFSTILEPQHLQQQQQQQNDQELGGGNTLLIQRETGLAKLQRQREEQMQLKHWVVAGAKDGKISLWEVF